MLWPPKVAISASCKTLVQISPLFLSFSDPTIPWMPQYSMDCLFPVTVRRWSRGGMCLPCTLVVLFEKNRTYTLNIINYLTNVDGSGRHWRSSETASRALQVTFKKEGLQKGDKKYVKVGIPVTSVQSAQYLMCFEVLLIFRSFDVTCATEFIELSRDISLTSYWVDVRICMHTDSLVLVHGCHYLCTIEMFDCAQCALLLPLTQVAFGRKRLRVEVKQEAPQRAVWQQDHSTKTHKACWKSIWCCKFTEMLS